VGALPPAERYLDDPELYLRHLLDDAGEEHLPSAGSGDDQPDVAG
jgi:hypothetical protein